MILNAHPKTSSGTKGLHVGFSARDIISDNTVGIACASDPAPARKSPEKSEISGIRRRLRLAQGIGSLKQRGAPREALGARSSGCFN